MIPTERKERDEGDASRFVLHSTFEGISKGGEHPHHANAHSSSFTEKQRYNPLSKTIAVNSHVSLGLSQAMRLPTTSYKEIFIYPTLYCALPSCLNTTSHSPYQRSNPYPQEKPRNLLLPRPLEEVKGRSGP